MSRDEQQVNLRGGQLAGSSVKVFRGCCVCACVCVCVCVCVSVYLCICVSVYLSVLQEWEGVVLVAQKAGLRLPTPLQPEQYLFLIGGIFRTKR